MRCGYEDEMSLKKNTILPDSKKVDIMVLQMIKT